jgi:hypothetical protein
MTTTIETLQMNATQLITDLAEQQITTAIVNAAKGKTQKKAKKMTLSDEIRSCFNIEKFLNDAVASIEELITIKINEAVAEKPTVKRASKKKVSTVSEQVMNVNETVDTMEITSKDEVEEKEVKPTKKRSSKKAIFEKSSDSSDNKEVIEESNSKKKRAQKDKKTVVDEPIVVHEQSINAVDNNTHNDSEITSEDKPKKKRAPTKSKKITGESTSETLDTINDSMTISSDDKSKSDHKPKKKRAPTKSKTSTEVSDSDTETQTKKPKKKNTKAESLVLTSEKTVDEIANEIQNMNIADDANHLQQDDDDSSVKTSDFIQPLTITDELEEEELSDIEN